MDYISDVVEVFENGTGAAQEYYNRGPLDLFIVDHLKDARGVQSVSRETGSWIGLARRCYCEACSTQLRVQVFSGHQCDEHGPSIQFPPKPPSFLPSFIFFLSFSPPSCRRRTLRASRKLPGTIPRRAKRKRHLGLLTQPPTAGIRRRRASRSAVAGGATGWRRHCRRGRCSGSTGGSGRATWVARGEDGLVIGRADAEGDFCFGADEGAARIVGGRTGGDGLAGAG